MELPSPSIPVTMFFGLPGMGRRNLIRQLLTQDQESSPLAFLVRDITGFSDLLGGASPTEGVWEVPQGQSGAGNLIAVETIEGAEALARKSKEVGAAGIGIEAMSASTFDHWCPREEGIFDAIGERAALDTIVAVVDASLLFDALTDTSPLRERDPSRFKDTSLVGGTVGENLSRQLHSANIILLTNIDGPELDPSEIERVEALVEAVVAGSECRVYRVTQQGINALALFRSGLFNGEVPSEDHLRLKAIPDSTLPNGLSHFSFTARRPFHPDRLESCIRKLFRAAPGGRILRSTGFAWLATRHNCMIEWSSSGDKLNLKSTASWLACCPQDNFPEATEDVVQLPNIWEPHPFIGDRRQELVFITDRAQPDSICKQLKKCLMTEEEFISGPGVWGGMSDSLDISVEDPVNGRGSAGQLFARAVDLTKESEWSEARLLFENLQGILHYNIACCDSNLEQHDLALLNLKRALESGIVEMKDILEDPMLSRVRNSENYSNIFPKDQDPASKPSPQFFLPDTGESNGSGGEPELDSPKAASMGGPPPRAGSEDSTNSPRPSA